MPFSTPASNQPVRTSTGSTSLVMGWLALPPQAAGPARTDRKQQTFDVRCHVHILFDTEFRHRNSRITDPAMVT